jgi:hypothetical protein
MAFLLIRMQSVRKIFSHAFQDEDNRLLMASSPIFIMHVLALGAFFTGFSWAALLAIFRIVHLRPVVYFSLCWDGWAHHLHSWALCGGRRIIATITNTLIKKKISIRQ